MRADLEKRPCPYCGSAEHSVIVPLAVRQFAPAAASYDLSKLASLGLTLDDVLPIARCAACGFHYALFLLPPATVEGVYRDLIDHQKSRAKIVASPKRRILMSAWARLFDLAVADAGEVDLAVLDYGCGWGDFMEMAAAPGVRCLGLETDKEKTKACRHRGLTVVESEVD
ncbi:MAG: class I SAM-dependent methyltransferase, partial [Lentisphaerae bacterium]|nr:class I SAM-dependent methyltransferase [Lentisphaerota bacterium]